MEKEEYTRKADTSIVVALTGASGSMGREALKQLLECDFISKIKLLLLNNAKEKAIFRRWKLRYGKRVEAIFGDIATYSDCQELVENADYLINMAAVIPPKSDHNHYAAYKANILGPKNLVDVLEKSANPPKFIHISSVAVYGNRDYKHPWGRVGDPLIPSVFDVYAQQKMTAELFVIESSLDKWCILRQTAMLHNKMLSNNMKDGLMFHTALNSPLEWVTAKDSGLLIKNIIIKDYNNQANMLWKNIYNIGGLSKNRCTGYETFDDGFKIIGGSAEAFLSPEWHITRNFHGMWFSDSEILNDKFDFVKQTKEEYWQEILKNHWYYIIAKILPKRFIGYVGIKRLLKDENSPTHWINASDYSRVYACFGDGDKPTKNWSDFKLFCKNQIANIDYQTSKNTPTTLSHGYDETKPDNELGIDDYRQAAKFRGGELLSAENDSGDLFTKATWKCSEGHTFNMTPFAVLKGGHWCKECNKLNQWNYDKLAKTNKFLAEVWYDTHSTNENMYYYFKDEIARSKKIAE